MKTAAKISENPSVVKDTKSFRERVHRISKLPVKDVLRIKMDELGIKNIDLQKRLGFPTPNVISMMKSGTMRVPIQHAVSVAEYLEIDKLGFLRKVVEENDPLLWDAMQLATGSTLGLTRNESNLLSFIRTSMDGFDPDLTKNEVFMSGLKSLCESVLQSEIEKKDKLLSSAELHEKEAAAE